MLPNAPSWRLRTTALALAFAACSSPPSAPTQPATGRLVINELAPTQPAGSDWVEICNPGTLPVALDGWELRTSNGTVLHHFGAGDVAAAGRRSVVGPVAMNPEVVATIDLPAPVAMGLVVLARPGGERVDAMAYTVEASAGKVVVVRPCDCQSRGDSDARVLPIAMATPGQPNSSVLCVSAPPTDGGVASVCNAYLPLDQAGRTWTYRVTTASTTGTQVWTAQGARAPEVYAVHVDTTLGATRITYDNEYLCSSGVVRQRTLNAVTTAGGVMTSSMTTLAPPPIILPAEVRASVQFVNSFTSTSVTRVPVVPMPITITLPVQETNLIEAEETITVPAGSFTTLRVLKTSVVAGMTSTTTYWYARGVGLVRSVGPPPGPMMGSMPLTHELVSTTP